MRRRMIRAGLVAILSLALGWGWAVQAGAAPTWSFELIPAGPLTRNPGDTIDFDMRITALSDAAVRFNPLQFGESGFSWDYDADKPGAVDEDSFTPLINESYEVLGNSSATFDFGMLNILNTAPGGTTITFIAKAVPDPIDPPNFFHDPFELEWKVVINIPREPGGVPLPGTALLLGVGLAGTLVWRARRG